MMFNILYLLGIILTAVLPCLSAPVANPRQGLPKNGERFEGDILMDNRLRNAILNERNRKRVSTILDGSHTWSNGTVPYIYASDFTFAAKRLLKRAFTSFEKRTCIRFKKRHNETDYVVFSTPTDGFCSSYIGRMGGQQVVNIGEDCQKIGSYKHELMHLLGILHEQSRPDRDEYIDIMYDNIDKIYWDNFHKYVLVDALKGAFNFASIMMYPNKAFSKNGNDTIDAIGDRELRFGQRERFSIGDVREINELYNCERYLKRPFYAGLYGNYEGNERRKAVLLERKKQVSLGGVNTSV